jgi:Peptidase M15
MTSYDATSTEVGVAVDDSEATEAEGVKAEIGAPPLDPEQAEALDRETLAGLDENERRELEEEAAAAAGDAALTAAASSGPLRLSRNFLLSEFHCCRGHCARASVPSDAVPALRRLVKKVLQPMRNEFGRCEVNSGYRNAAHNSHVGGVSRTRHRYDRNPATPAADVTFASGTVDEWAAKARERLDELGDIGGIGRYHDSNFVHVDLGPKRQWTG